MGDISRSLVHSLKPLIRVPRLREEEGSWSHTEAPRVLLPSPTSLYACWHARNVYERITDMESGLEKELRRKTAGVLGR